MPSAILSIRIIADATKAVKELDKSGKAAGKWSGGITKAATVAGVGLAALGGYALAGVKGAAEDAKAQAVLAHQMKKTAGATDASIAATEDWIAKQSLASGIADDDLRPALGALVTATGDVGTAQQALSSAMDISAATGQDIQSVSKALAKGYAGNTGAIGKLGLGIDKATLKAGNMGAIMGEVANKVGGASANAADTAAGKYQRMQVALAETQETLGAALLPALEKVLGVLQPMLAALSQNTPLVMGLVGAFAALAAILITAAAVTKLQAAATVISTTASKVAAVATKAWAAAQWLLNTAFGPVTLIIIAVVALAAAIVIAYKRSATFRAIVQGVMSAVLTAVKAVWSWIKTAWAAIWAVLSWPFTKLPQLVASVFGRVKSAVSSVLSWIKSHWMLIVAILTGPIGVAALLVIKNLDKIKAVARTVFGAITGFLSPVVDAFKSIWDWVKKIIDMLGKIKLPKALSAITKLNPFSKSAAPTVAVAPTVLGARRGGTRAVPVQQGGVTIQVNGAVDPQQTARIIQRMLHTADVRAGRRRFA